MKLAFALLALALVGMVEGRSFADCCADCGCTSQCCKVCRCVPDVKKVPKITYDCECEDFCVPGKSCVIGHKCVCPDPCEWSIFHHCHKEPIWAPGCATVRHRTKLIKKETIKEVPGWKWVVDDLCPKCSKCAQATNALHGREATMAESDVPADQIEEPTAQADTPSETQVAAQPSSRSMKQKLASLLIKRDADEDTTDR